MKKLVLIILGISAISSAKAQIERVWNDQAYIGNKQSEKSSIWTNFNYEISSNHLQSSTITNVFTGAAISRSDLEYTRNWEAAKPLLVNAETGGLISYRSKLNGKWRMTATFGFKEQVAVRTTTDFVALLLNGNADFQDQNLKLGQTIANYTGRQFLRLGGEYHLEKTMIGGWINLDKISRYQSLQITENSSLYTAPFGTEINGFVNLNWNATRSSQSQLSAWMGTGVGMSLYAASNSDSKFQWLLAAQDIKFDIYGGMSTVSASDSIVIKGYEIDDFNNLNNAISSPNIDSISSIIATQNNHASSTIFNGPSINIRLAYKLSDGVTILGESTFLHPVLNPSARISALLKYRDWFKFEPYVRLTGTTIFSPGLGLYFQNSESFRLILKTEQFTNLFTPRVSHNQYLFAALQFNL